MPRDAGTSAPDAIPSAFCQRESSARCRHRRARARERGDRHHDRAVRRVV